jgi:parvulin-like peptidyl-prolyl isomerase
MLMKQLDVKSPAELERELTRLGSSVSDVRQSFYEKAIASEWLRTKIKVNEEVSPDEMLEFYQTHASNYEEPLRVRWEELVVRKSRFASPAQAYAEIALLGNEVWQRAAARPNFRGPAFAEVAQARSDGFTAKDKGGEQPWTTKGALAIKVLDEALFSLQVGQMSPILETDDAFYIVRVLERKEAGRKPFTEVQAKIREDLKRERFRLAADKYLDQLRREARLWTTFAGYVSADEFIGRKPGETVQR